MRILYLKTGIISEPDVLEVLARMGFCVSEFDAPSENEKLSNEYAVRLFNKIEEFKPDFIFCLRYFSTVSVVCEAAKIKYAAWVCKSYEPDIYSCTLLNECNYIFFADKSLADEFSGGGFKHVYFMPLAVNKERILSAVESIGGDFEYDSDLTLMQDVRQRSAISGTPLSPDSPLSSATKGYLEGCIACQHQLSGLPSMAERLPVYAFEDLKNNFPPDISGDSVETQAHYYDYKYFNPLITYSQRDVHFHHLAAGGAFSPGRVHLYTKYGNYTSDAASVHEQAGYMTLPAIAKKSRINLAITNRNWKSAIPQISWDIMASGGFLISNIQGDYFEIFKERLPVLYEDKMDLRKKGIYYLKNESERKSIADELSKEIMDRHTYENRISKILNSL